MVHPLFYRTDSHTAPGLKDVKLSCERTRKGRGNGAIAATLPRPSLPSSYLTRVFKQQRRIFKLLYLSILIFRILVFESFNISRVLIYLEEYFS